jgi:hypothetical protein
MADGPVPHVWRSYQARILISSFFLCAAGHRIGLVRAISKLRWFSRRLCFYCNKLWATCPVHSCLTRQPLWSATCELVFSLHHRPCWSGLPNRPDYPVAKRWKGRTSELATSLITQAQQAPFIAKTRCLGGWKGGLRDCSARDVSLRIPIRLNYRSGNAARVARKLLVISNHTPHYISDH